MKRLVTTLLVAISLALGLAFPALAYSSYGNAYDVTDQLDSTYMETLGYTTLPQVSDEIGYDLRIDVVDDLEGETIEDYAKIFYDKYGYGEGFDKGGVLLMVYVTTDDTGLALEDFTFYTPESSRTGNPESDIKAYLDEWLPSMSDYAPSSEARSDWHEGIDQDRLAAEKVFDNFVEYCQIFHSLYEAEGSGATATTATTSTTQSEPAAIEPVIDAAGILTADEASTLTAKANELASRYGSGLYIVTVDDYTDYGSTAGDSARAIYNALELGVGNDYDGTMLMLSMEDRDYYILSHGDIANAAFTDYGKEWLADQFLDAFGEDDWASGMDDFLEASGSLLQLESEGTPLDVDSKQQTWGFEDYAIRIGFILLMSLLPAAAITKILKSKLTSVAAATEAVAYVCPGSETLTASSDVFLTTTRTVTHIEKGSSDSGSGGTTVDSDGFSGRGGKF